MKAPTRRQTGLPLASAAERLRRPPGRPRKLNNTESAPAVEANALPSGPGKTSTYHTPVPGLCPPVGRLLDLHGAASYLAVSTWTVRDLEAAGVLARVRVPLPRGGELRKVLFDREDLDRLIVRWKDSPAAHP